MCKQMILNLENPLTAMSSFHLIFEKQTGTVDVFVRLLMVTLPIPLKQLTESQPVNA